MKARRELALSFVRPDDLEAGRGHSEPLLFDRKPGHTEAEYLARDAYRRVRFRTSYSEFAIACSTRAYLNGARGQIDRRQSVEEAEADGVNVNLLTGRPVPSPSSSSNNSSMPSAINDSFSDP